MDKDLKAIWGILSSEEQDAVAKWIAEHVRVVMVSRHYHALKARVDHDNEIVVEASDQELSKLSERVEYYICTCGIQSTRTEDLLAHVLRDHLGDIKKA